MRKYLLSFAMTLLLALAIVPAAFADDTSELQNAINNASGGTLTLEKNYEIDNTVNITNGITINGNNHSITYTGNGSALSVTAQAAVSLQNVTINAENNGAYAIDLTSSQPNLTITGSTINAHTRGINMYPNGGCTNGILTISSTDINNSQVTDYVNQTTFGDTRGIALFDVKNSTISIENNSSINGFGYSVNVSGTLTNSIRDGQDTNVKVTNSTIQGWAAFNVWSCNMTFDITNSNLKGLNRLDSDWNNFATVVMNDNIYNGNANNANVVNITGGTIQAYSYGTASHCDFLESSECLTQYNFASYNGVPVYCFYPSDQAVFAVSFPGSSPIINGANNIVQIPVASTN